MRDTHMKRLSRGTPHILTASEIEVTLATVDRDPLLEQAIASIYHYDVEDWRKLPKAQRAKHIIDTQYQGRMSAILSTSLKARRDLLFETQVMDERTIDDTTNARLSMLEEKVDLLLTLIERDPREV